MIILGSIILNEEYIEAMYPTEDGYVCVSLHSGNKVTCDSSIAEAKSVLVDEGLLSAAALPVLIAAFTPQDREALSEAYSEGFCYVAKDQSGQVFAYETRPQKQSIMWNALGSMVKRIRGEFAALSFDDPEPLSIAEILGLPAGI